MSIYITLPMVFYHFLEKEKIITRLYIVFWHKLDDSLLINITQAGLIYPEKIKNYC
jgi:hypothetical protein